LNASHNQLIRKLKGITGTVLGVLFKLQTEVTGPVPKANLAGHLREDSRRRPPRRRTRHAPDDPQRREDHFHAPKAAARRRVLIRAAPWGRAP
jgi:hypothetical protein